MPRKVECVECHKKAPSSQISEGKHGPTCIKCVVAREQNDLETQSRSQPASKKLAEEELTPVRRKQLSQEELARREMARRHLIPFILRFYPKYKAGFVHKIIAAKLEKFYDDVQEEKSPRLMIFMPPQHGKSTEVSDAFPSWALGRDPTLKFILTSYTVSLPLRFSRWCRGRLQDSIYQALFPETKLHKDIQGAEHWETTLGGAFKAVGVGGGVTGHPANIIIVDDPIKDYEEAQSETIRDILHNWYPAVLRTRLSPGGGIIVVQTRWHDSDLAGRQLTLEKENREAGLSEEEIEGWDVVSFPAIAEHDEYIDELYNLYDSPGEGRTLIRKAGRALHPARYTLKELKKRKAITPSQQWSALYQQNPVPDTGEFFQTDDFAYYDVLPVFHHYPVIFSWDLAVGQKQHNDWTVGGAGLVVPQGELNTIVLLDVFRKRVRGKEQLEAIVNMYLKYKQNAYSLGIEYGQIFLAIEKDLMAEFRKKRITPLLDRTLKPVSDKRVRATPLRAWMQHHRVRFPRHQSWMETVRNELLRFDAGVYDDIVDMLAWMVRMANAMPLVTHIHKRKYRSVEQQLREAYRTQNSDSTSSSTGWMSA